VRDLFDFFNWTCRANSWPDQHVALDEAVKKIKGRCSFKTYIKNKTVRGHQHFCSATTYLWNAAFYTGKSSQHEGEDTSAAQRTVLELLQALSGKSHMVYMDNYYTSTPQFNKLWDMGLSVLGPYAPKGKVLVVESQWERRRSPA
jgi:Transposase IS4